jgi:hypothetical protein
MGKKQDQYGSYGKRTAETQGMKMLKTTLECIPWLLLLAAVLFNLSPPSARAQDTAFTYQGQLSVNGSPANGGYDLSFTLLDAATNGTVIGAQTNSATPVTNGLFTATLDFGGVFSGASYWLEIAARTNAPAAFSILTPRQPITSSPYAIYSATAAAAATAVTADTATFADFVAGPNITGTVPLAQLPAAVLTNNRADVTLSGTFYGAFNGNGAGLTNVNPAALGGTAEAGGLYPISPRLGFVATRGRYNGFYNNNNTWFSSMSYHIARDWITSPKVFFQGYIADDAAISAYNATVSAAIMYPTNVITQLTFGGKQYGLCPSNSMAVSDGNNVLKVPIPPGAGFWVRTFYTNTGGIIFSGGGGSGDTAQPQDTGSYGTTGGVDNTTNGGSMGTINSGFVYLPLAIVDKTAKPSPMIIGDSRCYGFGENVLDGTLENGYGRFFESDYGCCNLGQGGETLAGFLGSHTNKLVFTNYASVVIFELGINSYYGIPFASFFSQYTNAASMFSTLPVIGATMEPVTTSSDRWATFANQANSGGAYDANRTLMNTLLRNGQVPWVSRHMDPAAAAEGEAGKWIVNGTADGFTADGIHPDTAAILLEKESMGDPLVNQSSSAVDGGQLNSPLSVNGVLTVNGSVSGASFTGNGAGLTNISASAIAGGLSTNLLIAGHTFYITNGLIMNVQ